MKCRIFVGLIMLIIPISKTNAETLVDAKSAYFHRDYDRVEEISEALKSNHNEDIVLLKELRLLSIAVAIHKGLDDAGDELEKFLEEHPDNAYFQYFASSLWYRNVENVSIFSKLSMIKKHVAAMIKAAKLEPTNNRYQYRAASAYGQPSVFGGDNGKQKPIVDMLVEKGSTFAPMATMDYLQNTVNKEAAFKLIDTISIKYKDNIEILERAAQLLWTFDRKKQAGILFTAVCALPPGEFEAYTKWSDACQLSAMFATEGLLKKEVGLSSIERFIKFTKVDDKETQYALSLKKTLNTQPQ